MKRIIVILSSLCCFLPANFGLFGLTVEWRLWLFNFLQYRMPEAYDEDGGVNQEKRFAVALQRYKYFSSDILQHLLINSLIQQGPIFLMPIFCSLLYFLPGIQMLLIKWIRLQNKKRGRNIRLVETFSHYLYLSHYGPSFWNVLTGLLYCRKGNSKIWVERQKVKVRWLSVSFPIFSFKWLPLDSFYFSIC